MSGEITAMSRNEKEKQQLLKLLQKTLDLHEIGKVVKKGEVEGIDNDWSMEHKSGQIIKSKFKELGIRSPKEAELISFLVSNYHLLNELGAKKNRPEEVADKVKEYRQISGIDSKKTLELLRLVSNANNLSAIEVKNKNEGTNWSKEKVKKMIDDISGQVRQLL